MSEYLLEAPNGGSIANVAYCPCGVTTTSQLLYKEFLNTMFKDSEHCLGRAFFAAKCSVIAGNPTNDTIYGPAVLWTLFGDPALRIKHHVGSGIEENLKPQSPGCRLSAVPNPCDATVRLSFSSSQQAGNCSRVAIYNACGRLIDSRAVRASSFDLRTSSFPAGVYLLRLQAGTHTTTNKLVVHHQAALAR